MVDKRELLARLGELLTAKGLSRVHPDTSDPVAHAVGLALAISDTEHAGAAVSNRAALSRERPPSSRP